jgi:hypothetical protein
MNCARCGTKLLDDGCPICAAPATQQTRGLQPPVARGWRQRVPWGRVGLFGLGMALAGLLDAMAPEISKTADVWVAEWAAWDEAALRVTNAGECGRLCPGGRLGIPYGADRSETLRKLQDLHCPCKVEHWSSEHRDFDFAGRDGKR